MKIIVEKQTTLVIPASEMKDGDFGILVTGEFAGDVLYRNVAGFHGLTKDRYWPSQYIEDNTKKGKNGNPSIYSYMPQDHVRLLQVGETLIRIE